jgi:hypothetical protein
MASVVSRESYFEAGLDVLSDLGYGGLKLAEVCSRDPQVYPVQAALDSGRFASVPDGD